MKGNADMLWRRRTKTGTVIYSFPLRMMVGLVGIAVTLLILGIIWAVKTY